MDTNEGLVVSILGQVTRLHAHQADETRVVLVPCAARTLTQTSRLHLSLCVLNFSISRPWSKTNKMKLKKKGGTYILYDTTHYEGTSNID